MITGKIITAVNNNLSSEKPRKIPFWFSPGIDTNQMMFNQTNNENDKKINVQ